MAKYPDVESIIPVPQPDSTRLSINEEDAAFLQTALPRLPGQDSENSPITLDLNGQAIIRAKSDEQRLPTELTLARSQVTGNAIRLSTNRGFLAHALALGFRDFTFVNADKPVLCEQEHRKYLWQALGKEGAIAPSKDAIQVSSSEGSNGQSHAQSNGEVHKEAASSSPTMLTEPPASPAPTRKVSRRSQVTPTNGSAKAGNGTDLIAEAESLKQVLRDAYAQTQKLIVAIRHQNKQSRAVKATLASLRQLKQLAV